MFKAHRLLHHSTLGWTVIKKKMEEDGEARAPILATFGVFVTSGVFVTFGVFVTLRRDRARVLTGVEG